MSIIVRGNFHFLFSLLGTDKDAESLTRLFIYLGFYTNRFDNLTGKYITSWEIRYSDESLLTQVHVHVITRLMCIHWYSNYNLTAALRLKR